MKAYCLSLARSNCVPWAQELEATTCSQERHATCTSRGHRRLPDGAHSSSRPKSSSSCCPSTPALLVSTSRVLHLPRHGQPHHLAPAHRAHRRCHGRRRLAGRPRRVPGAARQGRPQVAAQATRTVSSVAPPRPRGRRQFPTAMTRDGDAEAPTVAAGARSTQRP